MSSNIVGVLIASASLFAAYLMGGSLLVTAIAVGVGSAVMVQASWVPLLATTPAVVVDSPPRSPRSQDEATTVTVTTISHPGLVAAVACILGASFGLLSEYLATVMTTKASTETVTTEGSPA